MIVISSSSSEEEERLFKLSQEQVRLDLRARELKAIRDMAYWDYRGHIETGKTERESFDLVINKVVNHIKED